MAYIRVSLDSITTLPGSSHVNVLEWDNCINSLAVGIKCAWAVTFSTILMKLIIQRMDLRILFNLVRYKSRGINGIDTEFGILQRMLEKNYSVTVG
jgi:starch synthase